MNIKPLTLNGPHVEYICNGLLSLGIQLSQYICSGLLATDYFVMHDSQFRISPGI